ILYGIKPTTLVDFSNPTGLKGVVLPSQDSFKGQDETALKEAFTAGIALLTQQQGRRVLVVIGTGQDKSQRNMRTARGEEMDSNDIEVYGIAYDPKLYAADKPEEVLKKRFKNLQTEKNPESHFRIVAEGDELKQAALAVERQIDGVWQAEFDGEQLVPEYEKG